MATRHLYVARHGAADAWGNLTDVGREQARLLGKRLDAVPVDAVWHSPLPRAQRSAEMIDLVMTGSAPVAPANELIDHVPYVPVVDETPPSWVAFFDGFSAREAAEGRRIAQSLTDRFASPPDGDGDVHEVLITHSYPIAWLIRDALDAPEASWFGLDCANAALTVIEYRPSAPPSVVVFNDMSHLPPDLRWTGFPEAIRV